MRTCNFDEQLPCVFFLVKEYHLLSSTSAIHYPLHWLEDTERKNTQVELPQIIK